MEEDVGLVILKHLADKLNIDILDVDFLGEFSINIQRKCIKEGCTLNFSFNTIMASLSFS